MTHILVKKKYSTSGRSSLEQGVALVETVIVLPVLLILAFGLADMYFAFMAYVNLNQANREGLMAGVKLRSEFEADEVKTCGPNTSYTSEFILADPVAENRFFRYDYSSCRVGNPNFTIISDSCGHRLVHWKIRHSSNLMGLTNTSNYRIRTECRIEDRMLLNDKTIKVQLSAHYNGIAALIIPSFRDITISTSNFGILQKGLNDIELPS